MKRGHAPQLSISDDNHHVTEAIGDLYGDYHYGRREPRPLSFLSSPLKDSGEAQQQQPPNTSYNDGSRSPATRSPLNRGMSNDRALPHVNGEGMIGTRSNSFGHENGPMSPTLPMRDRSPSDTANSQFPLNNLDYESNPAAVAQELSNLQALRRMSMDVNATGDPDLPAFNSGFSVPTIAPTGDADEDDTSRLFWVPARLHPELAPKEFKTFLDNRVESIKRRSGDSSLSPSDPQRHGSGGGLRRKKSMLSRQIDNSGGRGADGYTDGAERLDRKRSLSGQEVLNTGISNLQDLEVLVNDPAQVIQRLSLDTSQNAIGGEVPAEEDMPILPAAPAGGNSLRRSTRTAYRRGSLRKGERVPFSKRAAKAAETDTEDSPTISSPVVSADDPFSLYRAQPHAASPATSEMPAENFSRPARSNRARPLPPGASPTALFDAMPKYEFPSENHDRASPSVMAKPFVSQIATNGRSSLPIPGLAKPAPQIVETPPSPDGAARPTNPLSPQVHIPERVSSHEPPPTIQPQLSLAGGPPSARGAKRPVLDRRNQSVKGNQTLNDMVSHPSPLPGNSTRTDSLSFIPTLTEEKKVDSKQAKDKKEKGTGDTRKSSWSWGSLLGSEEKEKEKKKEEEAKKAKAKPGKPPEKSHDNTRLDVLQTTMEGVRGRESLVLDRNELKLDEERRKESSRKVSGGKEKDSGIFSSFFGGGKKKGEIREAIGKKLSSHNLSPDPPHRVLQPDVDYSWTRFSILEERAIYRMAHIKLANPRRALHSQVLLSNFMYSYLAKVQQMHPQIQIPQATAQKQQQRQHQQQQQQAQRKNDQPEEYYQYQRYQEVCNPDVYPY